MALRLSILRGACIASRSHGSSVHTSCFSLTLNHKFTPRQPSYQFSTWNWSKTSEASSTKDKDGNITAVSNDSGTSTTDISADAKVQKEILDGCAELYRSIMPLNEKIRGPLAKDSDRGTSLPFVFLVGNHSSGKSSFINYVLGRNIQTAGVAPTDDCFTVIAPGPTDTDQDGPALIGDPDMGFSNLRQFGPTLIHHTQLKVRSDTQTESFMMVDSPGMIDSPVSMGGMAGDGNKTMDRGYDFQGVVRWFADRADVVLLFFDPDKPGTTGETLSILLHSLGGMDHKLLIVLNKADQFKKIHDFARAYGSLCWNLSKVIPRKDLPRIFTMCLPMKATISPIQEQLQETTVTPVSQSLIDLHHTRDDVVAEVMKAPKRRIDNVITHLNDSVNLLLMHALIVEDTRKRYTRQSWENKLQEAASLSVGVGLTGLGVYMALPLEFTGGVVSATILGVGGMKWFNDTRLKDSERQLLTSEELTASFQRTHAREISEADEFTSSLWQRIKDPVKSSLTTVGLKNVEKVTGGDVEDLEIILREEIPKLRRMASPTHFGSQNKSV